MIRKKLSKTKCQFVVIFIWNLSNASAYSNNHHSLHDNFWVNLKKKSIFQRKENGKPNILVN